MQAVKIRDDRNNVESVETHRSIKELCKLIEEQRQLIEESNQRGYDATSAQIVIESLLISFSLCTRLLKQSAV
jgi:hypothetical protein